MVLGSFRLRVRIESAKNLGRWVVARMSRTH